MPDRRAIRYQFNWAFFSFSMGLLVVIGGLGYLWHSREVSQLAQSWLTRAAEFQQQQQYQDAVQYLSQYVTLRPGDPEGHVRMATAFDKLAVTTGQKSTAIQYYYRALGFQPERIDLRQRLAELLLDEGRFADAAGAARTVLLSQAGDPQSLRVLSLALYFPARMDAGTAWSGVLEALVAAQKANPTDVQLAICTADLYRNRLHPSRPEDADRVMDQVVEASKHSGSALLARSVYRRQLNLPGADDDLTAALQADPQDAKILLAAAESARRQRRWDDARNLYSTLIKVAPHDPQGFAGLGEIYREQQDFDTALKTWQGGLTVSGEESGYGLEMLWELGPRIADLLIDQRHLEEADKQLKTMETTVQKVRARLTAQSVQALNRQNDYLRAKWWLAERRALPAIAILERLGEPATAPAERAFSLVSPTQIQWLLAGALGSLGRWDQSAVIYERVISLQPNSIASRLAAANAWLLAGQIDAAIRHFDLLVTQPQVPQEAWAPYTQALLQQQLRLPVSERNWSALEQSLTRWPDQGTKDWQKPLLQSKYCLARAQPDQALTVLRLAERSAGDDEIALHDVALGYEELHQPAEADRVFQQWEKINQQPAEKVLFHAELLLRRGDSTQASAILQAAEASLPEADRRTVQHRLAQLQARTGKLNEARQTLAQLVAQQPEDIQPLEELAELALEAHDLNDAEHWEHQLHALEGENGCLWRWCRARRLLQAEGPADSAALAEAQRLTNELESRRPAWPESYVLRGLLAQRLGNSAEAVAAYHKAISLGDRRTAISERLVALLYESGQFDEAWQVLSQVQNTADNSEALSSLAIAVSLREREMDRAVGLAADWVQHHPDDPKGYLWLGQTQLSAKHNAEAERALCRATELAPQELRCWQALLQFYMQTEQPDAARKTLAKLDEQTGLPEAHKTLLLGECWEVLGDLPQAEVLYRRAAQAAPDDSAIQQRLATVLLRLHRPEANEVLEHLESTVQSDDASRNLAKLLATRDDPESINKALSILDHLDATHAQAASDHRLRAAILVRRGRAEDRQQAEQLLAALVADPRREQASDRLLLSKLYEADGLVRAARDQLQAMANRAHPELPELAAYADFLLRHDYTDEAELWIKRTDEASPGNFVAVALQARWLHSQHRTSEIETFVEAAVSRELPKLSSDAARGQFSLRVGELYSTVGLIDPAIQYYRQAYGLSPVLYAPLLSMLATHNRMAEAVQICREVVRTKPSAQPAITLATAMLAGTMASEELQLAEPILDAALQQNGDDLQLLLAVSGVRFLQGNLDEVMQLSRRVLKLDPQNLLALNNLSSLLAEQPEHLAEALPLIDRALQQDAHNPTLLDTKAMILFHQGQLPAAAAALDEIVAKHLTDARFRFHRALVYERMHDLNQARESLSAAQSSGLNPAQLTPTEKKLLAELEHDVAALGIRTGPELTSSATP